MRAKADESRRRLEAERARLNGKRGSSRFVDVMFGSAEIHREAGGGLLAGAIAFRFFLFIVPCVFVIIMVFGIGADLANANPRHVAREAGIAGLVASAIEAGADATPKMQWATLTIALVALAFAVVNLLKVLLVAHGLIWQVPIRRPRSSARASLLLLVTVVGASALLLLVGRLRELSFAGWLTGVILYIVVPSGLWLVLSTRWLPARDRAGWRDLWPGAVIFGVGTELLQVVTVLWVAQSLESKSETYGAIGAALTILVWAYLLGRLVTTAAAVNAALWRSRHGNDTAVTAPGPDESSAPDDASDAELPSLSMPADGVGPRQHW